jgi:hypothetical protein|tara:strand:+ start:1649 stop:2203 length:555 start_codon:yes stop_codon:yes gene_type:complete
MSRLVTNAIRSTAASSDAMTIDSAGKPSFPNGGVGKILQVVESADYSSQTSTSSTTFQDTGITATITPSSSSSKVLVLCGGDTWIQGTGYNVFGEVRLVRGSTEIAKIDHAYDSSNSSFGARLAQSFSINRLDSPNTTSATTYKIQIRVAGTGYSATIKNPSKQYGSGADYYAGNRIQLLEVAA